MKKVIKFIKRTHSPIILGEHVLVYSLDTVNHPVITETQEVKRIFTNGVDFETKDAIYKGI